MIDLGDGTAAIVDPPRFPTGHEALIDRSGWRLAWTIDTHSHADYVTGSPALVARRDVTFIALAASNLQTSHQAVSEDERVSLARGERNISWAHRFDTLPDDPFPIFFADHHLSVTRIGILAALYPAAWGIGQLYTGSLSDRIGRKPLIAGGMFAQAVALTWMALVTGFVAWPAGAVVLGVGTGLPHAPRRHR